MPLDLVLLERSNYLDYLCPAGCGSGYLIIAAGNLVQRGPSYQSSPRLSEGSVRSIYSPDQLRQPSLTPSHHPLSSEALLLEVPYKLLHELRFAQFQALDYHLRPSGGEIQPHFFWSGLPVQPMAAAS